MKNKIIKIISSIIAIAILALIIWLTAIGFAAIWRALIIPVLHIAVDSTITAVIIAAIAIIISTLLIISSQRKK